ncbi:helix-turn-helix domain-containing protein [Chitinophaga sp. Cy-1792]|uniref:helix-turn-helix domain-containing protein n=1 Tax=Chitinophaga sp. Cy-1792 TaxID=2608339 RepID=UPI00142003B7|nr:helix-turn-helix domain-containing protein [Chitinophaga sp. Cy-1792]NIG53798.1 helix-turn-helix domain-containing protein [Chitinophaga sp. Cy-1792]
MKISTKQEYFSAMAEIEGLYQKGFSKLNQKEEKRLGVLSEAIEAWETVHYPMPSKPDFPAIITYLLESNKLTQAALAEELNISKGFLSQLRHGYKAPNTEVLTAIHYKFHIDGNLLLESLPYSNR